MISGERNLTNEGQALDAGACAFLHKPFNSLDVDHVLHAAFGLRSPNLKLKSSAPNFDVAIEGSTIRLAHQTSAATSSNICGGKSRPICATASCGRAARCAIAPTQCGAGGGKNGAVAIAIGAAARCRVTAEAGLRPASREGTIGPVE